MLKYIPAKPIRGAGDAGCGIGIAINYVLRPASTDGLTVDIPTQQIYIGEFGRQR